MSSSLSLWSMVNSSVLHVYINFWVDIGATYIEFNCSIFSLCFLFVCDFPWLYEEVIGYVFQMGGERTNVPKSVVNKTKILLSVLNVLLFVLAETHNVDMQRIRSGHSLPPMMRPFAFLCCG